jgi:electron transfer flavoprotein alpha subunit
MTLAPAPTPASRPVWVLAECALGHVQKVTFELLGDARKLAALRKTPVETVLLCDPGQTARLVEELRPYEPGRVHALEHPALSSYTTDAFLLVLEPLIRAASPALVFAPATANGRDLAPRLAARAGMGFFPNCLTLRPAGGDRLEITRVTHGGGVHVQSAWLAEVPGPPLLVTMKPGVADAAPPNAAAPPPEIARHAQAIPEDRIRVRVLEHVPADPRVQDLREAERIVSGGRGVGGPEGFAVIQDLADALHAAVGASRVAVDLGWAPYERQVGQTGKTVAPQLYVAAGISGASHHLMGMRGSEKIVAINSDRKAPIFSVAHFGVVGDLRELLPALARRIRK